MTNDLCICFFFPLNNKGFDIMLPSTNSIFTEWHGIVIEEEVPLSHLVEAPSPDEVFLDHLLDLTFVPTVLSCQL